MISAQEFFTATLHAYESVSSLLADENIFEYPCEEELGDNPGKPYIVVQNTGTTQAETTKDDSYDPMHDYTTIEVVCVTSSKDEAKDVAKAAREAIAEEMDRMTEGDREHWGFSLVDSQYSDKGVQFDPESGNYFVQLAYRIETYNY